MQYSDCLVLCIVFICVIYKKKKKDFVSSVSFRVLRVQKEKEEAERKQVEAAIKREQEREKLIKEKESEILKLQV